MKISRSVGTIAGAVALIFLLAASVSPRADGSLVGLWYLDEESGPTVFDSSGSGAVLHTLNFRLSAQDLTYIVNHAGGIPGMYDDLIRVIAPRSAQNGPALLLMAAFNDVFLESSWPNGSDGTSHKLELIYYPTSTVDGNPQSLKLPQPDDVTGTDLQDLGNDTVRVELQNTRVKRRNDTRFLDTSFFTSAVAMITPSKRGSSYVVDIKLKQRVPYQQKIEGDMLAIDFERPGAPAAAAPAQLQSPGQVRHEARR